MDPGPRPGLIWPVSRRSRLYDRAEVHLFAGIFNLKLYFLTVVYGFTPRGSADSSKLALSRPSQGSFMFAPKSCESKITKSIFHIRLSKAGWF